MHELKFNRNQNYENLNRCDGSK